VNRFLAKTAVLAQSKETRSHANVLKPTKEKHAKVTKIQIIIKIKILRGKP